MKIVLLLALGWIGTAPALAQVPPAPTPLPAAPPTAGVFRTADGDEAARLAVARSVVAKLIPPGVYRTVLGAAMAPVTDGFADGMKALPLRRMAEMSGLSAKEAAALDKVDVERVMAIYDPHWQERSRLTMRAMSAAMADYFVTLEPELREVYARAYARNFSLADLHSLDAFFQTPAGAQFAGRYMTLVNDPAVAAEMKSLMPRLFERMPGFMAAAQKAVASLPPPRKLGDLSPADRRALAAALHVPESQLKDPKSPT